MTHYTSQDQETDRIDFTYNGWDCWFHPLQGWGAILSRKGERPLIIHLASKEALLEEINKRT
jgi:hypothetical protein